MGDTNGDPRGESTTTRRGVLAAAGAATTAGALAGLLAIDASASRVDSGRTHDNRRLFDVERTSEAAFPQSVASGGPTPSGAIVWTRVAEAAYEADEPLGLQVTAAPDRRTDNDEADFASSETVHFRLPAEELSPEGDYTVSVDLDGELEADRFYFYRFVHDGDASPVGRLRTLPAPDADPDRLRLAVASCNNYLHGYFGAYGHVAREDADYLVHLGDFVYEYGGDGAQPGRDLPLPSGQDVAHDLTDFRTIHRTYRSDDHLQAALERHTLVMTWDDHEIVNNRWWNYEGGYPNSTSHPYGDDPERMRQLHVDGIRALTEYLPFRVEYDPAADDLHDRFRLYRRLRFGRLADLFVTDERFYRSAPPEDVFGQRDLGVPPASDVDDPDRTMLGAAQREWFLDGVRNSPATWTVWANSVLNSALKVLNLGETSYTVNYDAWDGYEHERQHIMGEFRRLADRGESPNVVALTGDMHAYVASHLKTDYRSPEKQAPFPDAEASRVGVEFMAPAISSDNLGSMTPTPPELEEDLVEAAIVSQNPHVEWFNWSRHGYATVEFTDDAAIYTAYGVDRTVDAADAPKRLLRSYRVPEGEAVIEELDGGGPLVSTPRGDDTLTTDGIDVGAEEGADD